MSLEDLVDLTRNDLMWSY